MRYVAHVGRLELPHQLAPRFLHQLDVASNHKKVVHIEREDDDDPVVVVDCLLYTSPSPRDRQKSRMPSSA